MPAPSRDAIAVAVGKCVFLKLAPQDTQKLLAPVGAKVDWKAVRAYTAQAVRSPQAAACLSGHFTEQLAVLNAVLEPKLFLGGASPCLADLVLAVALHGCFAAFDDQHKWALCNASRWFDLLQHRAVALGMPDDLKPGPPVTFVYDAPEPLPAIESLAPLATDAEGVACYRGVPFATAAGKCTAAIKSAPIS
ncbi:hypothetical protein EMIHUDRAFT_450238 [Emiliania huxleyi CCMP1516]|uniref:GST C-terminal domain-containing protein n=2 Tax=Emiliania huxleyi TaxID=2903 RepID=A0A0D3JUU0_EMIH1|nr:hypothetical protein EMIHUDRAFT_450238 [Emiliania huxleyi CCMP1516]EOD27275.1 hypothetical protein EMIHUDRAFT_450238 [Emiliania huxleyi CCMP1516]|eukprot:XP_005779704.1 hypothetical protein EMIHUDRAFT_450238 [Emiliania huxleyi CCMP1516]